MLAYGLTRFSLPGSGFVFFLILGGMALSEQVALVPLYKILQALKLYNTRAALILPYIAFRIPFTMFLMRAYFISIPKELEEAAIVDGCNSFQRFTQIILPISKPVMASCAIVNLNNVWNEFLFANVFLENKKLMTIPLGLMTFQGDLKSDYVVMLAGILIASLPMVLLFLCMSKQFVRGLTSGAVKGLISSIFIMISKRHFVPTMRTRAMRKFVASDRARRENVPRLHSFLWFLLPSSLYLWRADHRYSLVKQII